MRKIFLLSVLLLLLVGLSLNSAVVRADQDVEDEDDEYIFEEQVVRDVPKSAEPQQPPAEKVEGSDASDPPPLQFSNKNSRSSFNFSDLKLDDYHYELYALVFFVVYGVNYFYGKQQNEKIVKAWVKANWGLFEKNFSYFGDGKGNSLIKDSESDYIFYASGREHCKSLTAHFELRKRHDLVGLLMEFVNPVYDRVKIDVVMNDKDMQNLVFAINGKNKILSMKKDHFDMAQFTKVFDHKGLLPENFSVATETSELVDQLLTKFVSQTIQNSSPYFENLKFSDQTVTKPSIKDAKPIQKVLSFTFRIPPANQMQKTLQLQELVIYFIDHLSSLNLSPEARSKIEKARNAIKEVLQKELHALNQEKLQNLKAEKLKKEKEMVEQMSPEQQRKWEAKNYQKELKKKQASRMKVVKG